MVATKSILKVQTLSLKMAKQIRVLDNPYGEERKYLIDYIHPRLKDKRLIALGWVKGNLLEGNRAGVYWLVDTPKGLFFVYALDCQSPEQLFIS